MAGSNSDDSDESNDYTRVYNKSTDEEDQNENYPYEGEYDLFQQNEEIGGYDPLELQQPPVIPLQSQQKAAVPPPEGSQPQPPIPPIKSTYQAIFVAPLFLSDASVIRYLKELTKPNDAGGEKKNAVVMDTFARDCFRREMTPFPECDIIVEENLFSGVKTLSPPLYNATIANIFVMGFGDMFRDIVNDPRCKALHVTDPVEKSKMKSFGPDIDMEQFHPWHSSFPREGKSIRYTHTSYVRVPGIAFSQDDDHIFAKHVRKVTKQILSFNEAMQGKEEERRRK